MSQVAEITIDLTKTNCKPKIKTYEIIGISRDIIYCRDGAWKDAKKMFCILDMGAAECMGTLKYTYRYQTEENDFAKIAESKETADAVKYMGSFLTEDLNCYQGRLKSSMGYYSQT